MIRIGIIAIFVMCIGVGVASACGVCMSISGNPLALPHPRAIEIAVATRSALDKGIIRPNDVRFAKGWERSGRQSSAVNVQKWCERFGDTDVTLHVVLIDTSESYIIHARNGAILCEAGRMERNGLGLATTTVALQAMLDGQLDCKQAVRSKLLIASGTNHDKLMQTLLASK